MDLPFYPKPYPHTDNLELDAIRLFQNLIDRKRIKDFILNRDKVPNHDGNLEIVDVNGRSMGFIFVQIKRLNDDQLNPPKIVVDTSFLGFCQQTNVPVILLGADCVNSKVFWLHINNNVISQLKFKNKEQKSKMIEFPLVNEISNKKIEYIQRWEEILDSYKIKIKDFDEINKINNDLTKKYTTIELNHKRDEFKQIHQFLDELNYMWDTKFSVIKEILYDRIWKIGLVFFEENEKISGFTTYPIPENDNDVLIKKGDRSIFSKIEPDSFGRLIAYGFFDPLRTNPKDVARITVYDKIKPLLEFRFLKNQCHDILNREFVFAFIDKFALQLGLKREDLYRISDLEQAYSLYLPIWMEEAMNYIFSIQRNRIKSIEQCYSIQKFPYIRYIDPSSLTINLLGNERELVTSQTQQRMKTILANTIQNKYDNDKFHFQDFRDALNLAKNAGMVEITRPFISSDVEKCTNLRDKFSPVILRKNLDILFNNFIEVYTNFIKINFPALKNELDFFGIASKIIVFYEINEKSQLNNDGFKVHFFFLKNLTQTGDKALKIIQMSEQIATDLLKTNTGQKITYDGTQYSIVKSEWRIFDEIFHDTPLLDIIYEILKEKLEKYFFHSVQVFNNAIRAMLLEKSSKK